MARQKLPRPRGRSKRTAMRMISRARRKRSRNKPELSRRFSLSDFVLVPSEPVQNQGTHGLRMPPVFGFRFEVKEIPELSAGEEGNHAFRELLFFRLGRPAHLRLPLSCHIPNVPLSRPLVTPTPIKGSPKIFDSLCCSRFKTDPLASGNRTPLSLIGQSGRQRFLPPSLSGDPFRRWGCQKRVEV